MEEKGTGALSQQEKGALTRQRRYEQRQEKKRLAALNREQEAQERRREDERFMREAIRQARKAASLGDVPIGCVIVRRGQVIARGYNRRNADGSVLAHAEAAAIRRACRLQKDWRLEDCTLYVTLEPCPMCAGAIVQSRIPRVVIGSMNPKAGCAGSVLDLLHEPGFNHQCETQTGILRPECEALLKDFFRSLRAVKAEQTPLDKTTPKGYT